VLPFNSIEEIIVPEENTISIMDDGSRMLFNRGVYVPLVSSREVFMMDEEDEEKLAAKAALAEQSVIPDQPADDAASKLSAADTERSVDSTADRHLIVIISHEGKSYGIEVDRIIGKQEIVIKNLGESLGNLHIYSGERSSATERSVSSSTSRIFGEGERFRRSIEKVTA
jgi:chemotaxis protein histidine kinase CheA